MTTKQTLQRGFIPVLVLIVAAAVVIGGGAYAAVKYKKAKMKTEVGMETNMEVKGAAKIRAAGSLRSLLGMGKNVMCAFTSTAGGVSSSGTVYIAASGAMRGDFNAAGHASNMIVKDGMMYGWTGDKGVKMKMDAEAQASAEAKGEQAVGLDSQVDYSCSGWAVDESKFTVPSSVQFIDLDAMMKGSVQGAGSIDIKSMMQIGR